MTNVGKNVMEEALLKFSFNSYSMQLSLETIINIEA